MKKILTSTVAAIMVITTASTVHAVPYGRSNEGFGYLFKNPVLSRVTAGIYTGDIRRDVKFKFSSFETELDMTRTAGYLGISLLEWLNVYGMIGQNSTEVTGYGEADDKAIYGAGISINLLNHFLREPIPMEDAFRLNFGLEVLKTETQFLTETLEWNEINGALTLSIVNHTTGNKEYTPESIVLYAGPAFTFMRSDDFESKNYVGGVCGLEIFFTDSCSLDLRVEYFDGANFSTGINLHF